VRINPLYKMTPSTGASDASCTAPTPAAYTPALAAARATPAAAGARPAGLIAAKGQPLLGAVAEHGAGDSAAPKLMAAGAGGAHKEGSKAVAAGQGEAAQSAAGEEEGTPDSAQFTPSAFFSPELPIRQQLTALTVSRGAVPSARKQPPPASSITDSAQEASEAHTPSVTATPPAEEFAAGVEQVPAAAAGQDEEGTPAAAEEGSGDVGADENFSPAPLQAARLLQGALPPKTPQSAVRRARAAGSDDADAPTPMRNPLRIATPARRACIGCPAECISADRPLMG
jgi:hypothetical protein